MKKEKLKFLHYFKDKPLQFKGTLILSVLVLMLISLLIMPIMKISDPAVDLSVNIYGFDVIASFGNEIQKYVYSIGDIFLTLPKVPSILLLISFILIIVSIIATIISTFTKFIRYQNLIIGITLGITSLYTIIIYLFLITTKNLSALDFYGNTKAFFEVYSLGINILINIVLGIFLTLIAFFLKPNGIKKVRKNFIMYLLLIIPLTLMFIFKIYPIFLQIILSLKEYVISDGIWGSKWVGFANFRFVFQEPDMLKLIGNTVVISVSRILISIIPPIILAIILYEMGRDRFRKGIQTVLYIPHFFSWIVVYGIAYAFINPEGLINNIMLLTGNEPIKILTSESKFIPLLLTTDLWKELGWGTILYVAALSNVDPNLYEAAAIDGAGFWKKLTKITLPSIAPTIVFVSVMAIGNILSGAGFEQIMLFGSENMEKAQVIDTWVYWEGLNELRYGLGAAVSFFQSAIGLVLVLLCNKFSKRYVGIGLF
jgi:putative aldouronate transport system permease protein